MCAVDVCVVVVHGYWRHVHLCNLIIVSDFCMLLMYVMDGNLPFAPICLMLSSECDLIIANFLLSLDGHTWLMYLVYVSGRLTSLLVFLNLTLTELCT